MEIRDLTREDDSLDQVVGIEECYAEAYETEERKEERNFSGRESLGIQDMHD